MKIILIGRGRMGQMIQKTAEAAGLTSLTFRIWRNANKTPMS